jgi:broad specificity phosphatase PhoE/predicted kinase
MFTPKEVLPTLNAMNAFGDHLPVDQIPDGFGLSVEPEFRNKVKRQRQKKRQRRSNFPRFPQLLIVMVGLPARGKSYTATKVYSYLKWLGINTKVFNVGVYRRQVLPHTVDQSAQFFEASNLPAKRIRDQLATEVLDQLFEWLEDGGEVAIFDATNTTNERRKHILARCSSHKPSPQVLFIENICDDPYVLAENFKQKILISPDYESLSVEGASLDLKSRIVNYEKVYETITDSNLSYIKVFNLKAKVICNHITGTMHKMVADYVLRLHIITRSIWFARPARCISEDPAEGDLEFTENGQKYTRKLAHFVQKRLPESQVSQLLIFTGTNARSIRTAQHIKGATIIPTSVINGLDGGLCHNITPQQMSTDYPEVWNDWQEDRFNYRLPGGESFADMIQRLRSFVLELEQLRCPVLIITHTAAIQGLYAYFKQIDVDTAPYYYVPQNTVVELVSTRFGWKEKHYYVHSL